MARRCCVWLLLALGGLTGIGLGQDASPPARKPKSRFSLSSPRSVSPVARERNAAAHDEPAIPAAPPAEAPRAEAPPVQNPSRVPTLDEMILFQPNKRGDWAPKQLQYTDVDFESGDGTQLHAWYCPATTPRAVVLYCHGNAGNIAWLADYFEFLRTKHRMSILAFDYRGYGKSKGTPTVEGVLADGRAARAKLAELAGAPASEIVVWGRSMGGAVAVQLASEERPRGLILECTFDSFKTVAQHHAPRWAFLVPQDRLASVKRIPLVTCPLLQVHGTADRVVPFSSGQALFAAANEPKQFIQLPNADHNTPSPPGLYTQIDRFLDQTCPPAAAR